jgi:hypothetical protein
LCNGNCNKKANNFRISTCSYFSHHQCCTVVFQWFMFTVNAKTILVTSCTMLFSLLPVRCYSRYFLYDVNLVTSCTMLFSLLPVRCYSRYFLYDVILVTSCMMLFSLLPVRCYSRYFLYDVIPARLQQVYSRTIFSGSFQSSPPFSVFIATTEEP